MNYDRYHLLECACHPRAPPCFQPVKLCYSYSASQTESPQMLLFSFRSFAFDKVQLSVFVISIARLSRLCFHFPVWTSWDLLQLKCFLPTCISHAHAHAGFFLLCRFSCHRKPSWLATWRLQETSRGLSSQSDVNEAHLNHIKGSWNRSTNGAVSRKRFC